ncbi:MAG: hypothetical protein ACE5EM_04930 [Sphingomonadales bacterium]
MTMDIDFFATTLSGAQGVSICGQTIQPAASGKPATSPSLSRSHLRRLHRSRRRWAASGYRN